MNRQRRLVLQAGGLAVLGCAIGLAVFLLLGSKVAILFTAVGVPVLLVGFGGVYVWSVYDRSGTNQSEYIEHRARSTADVIRDIWTEYDQLQTHYPEWSPEAVEIDMEQVLADLEEQGVSFDEESATYSLGRAQSRDIQELDRLESVAEELERRILESFQAFVDEQLDTMDRELSQLVDADIVDQPDWPERTDDPPEDTDELTETLDRYRTEALTVIDRAAETLEMIVRRHETSGSVPLDRLVAARDTARNWEFSAAADHVLAVRDTVESELSTAFDDESRDLERLLEALQAHAGDTPVQQETLDRIEELEADITGHESSLELQSLRERREELRSVCAQVIRALDAELNEHLDTLDHPGVPDEYAPRPRAAERAYLQTLNEATTLEEYRERWVEAVTELSTALGEVRTKASIVETYPKLESRIDDILEREGRVTEEDLPMRSPTELMRLYALSNPEISFDPTGPVLMLDTDRGSFTVAVAIAVDSDEGDQEIDVSLEERSRTRTESVRVDGSAEVRFDEVPYGECTVRAVPVDQAYEHDEVTVVVDEDTRLEMTVSEASVVDQLCKGRANKVQDYLDDFASELEGEFRSEGYVSSQMSFPLSDDYIPCLLALWADREGFAVAVDDGGGSGGRVSVYVYDDDTVQSEIETTVKYNVDPGEAVSFESLRSKFLSAPVPDTAIRDMVERIDIDGTEVTGTTIERTEVGD